MEEDALFVTELTDFSDGLQHADLIIAAMIVTRMVLSSMARFRSSRSINPSAFTGR